MSGPEMSVAQICYAMYPSSVNFICLAITGRSDQGCAHCARDERLDHTAIQMHAAADTAALCPCINIIPLLVERCMFISEWLH